MSKNLTLVPVQRKELESDLVQESFLKDYEKVPGYKASFEFKTKIFASMRFQRTSLVPLWISVGLMLFRMVNLKLVTPAWGRKMSLLCSSHC